MNTSPSIILIGFMGAGKTTLGQKLAYSLGRPFIDLDEEIQKRSHLSIPEIFARGQTAFRRLEAQVLKEQAVSSGKVIATGGGVVELAENRELLTDLKQQRWEIVWVKAPLSIIKERIKGSTQRPLANLENLTELYQRREKYYRELATQVIENVKPTEETIRKISLTIGEL